MGRRECLRAMSLENKAEREKGSQGEQDNGEKGK